MEHKTYGEKFMEGLHKIELKSEIENVFETYDMTERIKGIVDFVEERKIRLQKLKKMSLKENQFMLALSIKEELQVIYMLEMMLTQLSNEMDYMVDEVLELLSNIEKTASDSLQTKEADKKDTVI
ncbi:hypothetical protein [Mammaliicoccus sciuri]|uniref:Uncharacterized protein n=1 Tax=Mammaliicoccus sciuri TaxID=1296 RepID=A0AAI8GUW8_MAMSC|nr:hypothetical protein [Mammaliicoccus sciuri]ASE35352.1 hypothetical protein CEP64_12385 [Mammaliicoccus sciuri]